jgi:hypothetical protein
MLYKCLFFLGSSTLGYFLYKKKVKDNRLSGKQDLFCKDDILSISACCSEYKLLPWIDMDKEKMLDQRILCSNPNAIHLIEEHIEIIEQYIKQERNDRNINSNFYKNPNCIHLIEKIIEKDIEKVGQKLKECDSTFFKEFFSQYSYICSNSNAVHLIKKILDINEDRKKIFGEDYCDYGLWEKIFKNPNCIDLIERKIQNEPGSVTCFDLSENPNAIHLVDITLEEKVKKKYGSDISWPDLFLNPNAVHLIDERIKREGKDCIAWYFLCKNPNMENLIREKYEKKDWTKSDDQSVFKRKDTFSWWSLCANPNLYTLSLIEERVKNEPDILWTKGGQPLFSFSSKMLSCELLSGNPSIFKLDRYNKDIFDILSNLN